MTVGAKLWKVGRIKSGVGCVETVVSLMGGHKERVATGLFGVMARGDWDRAASGAGGGWVGVGHLCRLRMRLSRI